MHLRLQKVSFVGRVAHQDVLERHDSSRLRGHISDSAPHISHMNHVQCVAHWAGLALPHGLMGGRLHWTTFKRCAESPQMLQARLEVTLLVIPGARCEVHRGDAMPQPFRAAHLGRLWTGVRSPYSTYNIAEERVR